MRRGEPGGQGVEGLRRPWRFGIVDDFDGDTYRAVYTVKFFGVIYVLHAFQKKSKKGIATPQRELDLVKTRMKRSEEHYRDNYAKGSSRG